MAFRQFGAAAATALTLAFGRRFGAAIRALIDEVDLRHAPMGFDLPDIHGKQSHTAGADDRSVLALVMLNVGWHVGSPFTFAAEVR